MLYSQYTMHLHESMVQEIIILQPFLQNQVPPYSGIRKLKHKEPLGPLPDKEPTTQPKTTTNIIANSPPPTAYSHRPAINRQQPSSHPPPQPTASPPVNQNTTPCSALQHFYLIPRLITTAPSSGASSDIWIEEREGVCLLLVSFSWYIFPFPWSEPCKPISLIIYYLSHKMKYNTQNESISLALTINIKPLNQLATDPH